MNKFFQLTLCVGVILLTSCSLVNKKPSNVRELMESDGWVYCERVVADIYYDGFSDKDKRYIGEDMLEYDLFKKGKDYVLTTYGTDTRSLSKYDSKDEHLKSSCWINYYVAIGDYTVCADHFRKGTERLGIITKKYNAKAIKTENLGREGTIYFVISSIKIQDGSNEESSMSVSNIEEDDVNEEEPVKKYKTCPVCYGTTRCGGCGGSGSIYNAIDYDPGQYVDCSSCNGSGACGMCNGTGMVEDLGW